MVDHAVNIVVSAKDQASAVFGSVGKSLESMNGLTGLATRAMGMFGVSLSVGELIRFSLATMKSARDLKQLSFAFGESAETLGKWKYMASIEGLEFDRFSTLIKKMNDTVGTALLSGKRSVFDQIGLDVQALATQGTDETLNSIADALSHINNAAIRTKYAVDIFGKGALEILPMLRDGSSGLKSMADEGQKFGAVLSNLDVEKLAIINKAFSGMKEELGGKAKSAVSSTMGFLLNRAWFLKETFSPSPESGSPEDIENQKKGGNPSLRRKGESLPDFWRRVKPTTMIEKLAEANVAKTTQENEQRKGSSLIETMLAEQQVAIEKQHEVLSKQVETWKKEFKTPYDTLAEMVQELNEAMDTNLIGADFAKTVLTRGKAEYYSKTHTPIEIEGRTKSGFELFESRTALGRHSVSPESRQLEKIITLTEKQVDLLREALNNSFLTPAGLTPSLNLTNFR